MKKTQKKVYRIAYIIDELVGATAGTERQLLTLIRGLRNTGFEPYLLALRPSRYLDNITDLCPVDYLHVGKLFSINAIIGGIKLIAYLRAKRISIAHIFFNDSSIFAPFFCKIAGVKVIVSRRDLGFWYTPHQVALLKMNRLFVDCIAANSKAVREVVCNKEGYSSDKICVIYNGHNLNRFKSFSHSYYDLRRRFNIPSGTPIIGMVANFHKYKRHEDLIDAFSVVHKEKPETHLVLIGDGEREKELKDRVAVIGLNQVVHFTGRLGNVIPAVQELTVCVLCSETEGFSNALIEYMGCGKPVVATKVGGNLEIVQDCVNGFLVPVGNKKGLANRILLILNDSNASNKLGFCARETAYYRYSFKRMLNSYLSLYKRLVNNKNI